MCVCVCRTVLKQTASMDVFGFPVLSGLLENVWCSNYKSKLMEVIVAASFPW